MGVQTWELIHPERIPVRSQALLSLRADCRLLFVSSVKPIDDSALFYQKILKAMTLELTDTLHISPEQLLLLDGEHIPEWIWFAGDDKARERFTQLTQQYQLSPPPKKLVSPHLTNINGNDMERRALWNQIRAYG